MVNRNWIGASRTKNGMNTSPAVLDGDLMKEAYAKITHKR